jgi:hypothetical protein
MGTGQFADQISGDAVLTALGKTFNAANPFGAFVFAMGGNDTVVGTAGTDFAVTTQFGSHLVDGGADAGYFNYASGSPVISGDQYRLLEQKLVPKDASGATNGGYVAADVTTTNYRMVNLQQWAGFATNPLSAISGTLNNRLTGNAIDSTDLGNISATASSLGLTGVGGNGYTWAVVKYAVGGSLLGVDFLKNIETVQFGLFYDSNRNDIAQGSIGETLTPATLSYTIANDSYTLTEAQKTWLNLGGSDHVGLVNGTTFNDTIDLSALSVPSYQTGNGFVANGLNGNDTIIGSSGGDILIGGGAIDTITTGSGVDIVNFTGVTLAGGRDVVTDFTVGTDGIAIMASSTSAGTAVGTTAVVANVSAAATNASGAAFDLAAALTPATNTVDLVTLSASALTNKANANLASSTDGTDLLKALVALGGGNTASGIQVDGIGHTFYLAVDDGTNGYLYLANSGADNLVTAGEVALIGTFNNAQISGLDSAHVGLV